MCDIWDILNRELTPLLTLPLLHSTLAKDSSMLWFHGQVCRVLTSALSLTDQREAILRYVILQRAPRSWHEECIFPQHIIYSYNFRIKLWWLPPHRRIPSEEIPWRNMCWCSHWAGDQVASGCQVWNIYGSTKGWVPEGAWMEQRQWLMKVLSYRHEERHKFSY